MINIYARQIQSLDGKWHVIIDPYDNGYYNYRYEPYDAAVPPTGGYFLDRPPKDKTELVEYNFDQSPTLLVPRDWNSQDNKLLCYEGSLWYRRRFDCPPGGPGKRLFLYFGAANYTADVYLNGRKLGQHLGGFTPFEFEITGLVTDTGNSLVVRVNNQRRREGVPTLNTDWWNYGGLTRDVLLVETPETFVADYVVQLKPGTRDVIAVKIQLDGACRPQTVRVTIPELKIAAQAATNGDGRAVLEIPAPNLALWSPADPKCYRVTVACDTDEVAEQIGFRSIAVRGTDILLNGQPVFLRGIAIHEENPLRGGRVGTEGEARMLLTWAKELNCNFVRLAHYPHSEYMARIADEMGLMVWEEIPVYWTILWDNPATLDNATNQLTELINRDKNRASVIVWSVANETPVSEARTRFLKTLVDHARSLDNTRLISAAMEVHRPGGRSGYKIVDDPFGEFTDLVSFNEYVGWYDGLPDKCARIRWSIKYPKAGRYQRIRRRRAAGMHADKLTRFSEEYPGGPLSADSAHAERIPQFRG